ncbi:MAG: hypothetical protein KGS45_08130 [Planctomycetes bacterium]|nr:hypothetical protein [Planctomycetota bacterium]
MPLRDLIEQTNPHLPANVLSHIQRVRTARSQSADPTLRAGLMRIPMQAAHLDSSGPSPFFAKSQLGFFDILKVIGVTAGATAIYLAIVYLSAVIAEELDKVKLLGYIPCMIFVLGPTGFLIAGWRYKVSRTRTRTTALIARGFRPFQPTLPEVEEQIAWATLTRLPMAKRLNAEAIHQCCQAMPDKSLHNANELKFDDWGRQIILDHQIQEIFDMAIESERSASSPADDSQSDTK